MVTIRTMGQIMNQMLAPTSLQPVGCWSLGRCLLAVGCGIGLAVAGGIGGSQRAIALQTDPDILLLSTKKVPLDINLLLGAELPADGSIVTANTISQLKLTVPSLWWTDQQFGDKLLSGWIAYSGENDQTRRVDLVVNQQVWSIYNYLERYTFVNRFGTDAGDYRYSTRVFNQRQELLAAYICDFPNPEDGAIDSIDAEVAAGIPADEPLRCNIFLESVGQGSLRGRSTTPFSADQATDDGIE